MLVACVGFNIFYTDPLVPCTDPLTFACSERNTSLIFRLSTHMFYKSEVPIQDFLNLENCIGKAAHLGICTANTRHTKIACFWAAVPMIQLLLFSIEDLPKMGRFYRHTIFALVSAHIQKWVQLFWLLQVFFEFSFACVCVCFWQLQRDTCTGRDFDLALQTISLKIPVVQLTKKSQRTLLKFNFNLIFGFLFFAHDQSRLVRIVLFGSNKRHHTT